VVLGHGSIAKDLSCDLIDLKSLENKNIDYLALGHIHSNKLEKLDVRGVWAYSGILSGRGFDECGEKGFVLLDITDGKISSKFIPFAKRQLIEVKFDLTQYSDWFDIENKILTLTKDIQKEHLLKIVLTGKYNIKLEKHLSMLEQKLEKFYFVKIKDESTLEVTIKDIENDISLRGEFIRKVLSSKLSEEEKEMVILVGLKALQGED
jgi:DNA repair exonuclease SbcCD nuclease subunit